jgi:hypothetical protein
MCSVSNKQVHTNEIPKWQKYPVADRWPLVLHLKTFGRKKIKNVYNVLHKEAIKRAENRNNLKVYY